MPGSMWICISMSRHVELLFSDSLSSSAGRCVVKACARLHYITGLFSSVSRCDRECDCESHCRQQPARCRYSFKVLMINRLVLLMKAAGGLMSYIIAADLGLLVSHRQCAKDSFDAFFMSHLCTLRHDCFE
eukprot:1154694-Amphidinium_carterae.1